MTKKNVLIVEDDTLVRDSLSDVLAGEGYGVTVAANAEEGLMKLEATPFDAALIDLKLPGINGIDFLQRAKSSHPKLNCIMMSSYASAETAVQTIKVGADDYLSKPIDDGRLKAILDKTFEIQSTPTGHHSEVKAGEKHAQGNHFHNLVGEDSQMAEIYSLIKTINDTDVNVLIKGESGTGKGMIAQAIHYSDPARKNAPYIEVSCGAIPRELMESELFGHVKGAFTSAIRDRIGRFELANGGTILLDEIDALSPYLQVKLLRVIQQKVFEMVGDTKTKRVDVRIIAATNRDLEEEIRKGNFREDLYYRLKVITVEVPPLRDRKTDIPLLTKHFLKVFNEKQRRNIRGITKEAMNMLVNYPWPGNVRELENTIERVVVLSKSEIIDVQNLPLSLSEDASAPWSSTGSKNALKANLKDPEKKLIVQALEQSGWNRKKAASLLNISRTTLYNKIKEYQLL